MDTVGKLDEKKKQKREALLGAAYDLFTSQGIFDTSISDIVIKYTLSGRAGESGIVRFSTLLS